MGVTIYMRWMVEVERIFDLNNAMCVPWAKLKSCRFGRQEADAAVIGAKSLDLFCVATRSM